MHAQLLRLFVTSEMFKTRTQTHALISQRQQSSPPSLRSLLAVSLMAPPLVWQSPAPRARVRRPGGPLLWTARPVPVDMYVCACVCVLNCQDQ